MTTQFLDIIVPGHPRHPRHPKHPTLPKDTIEKDTTAKDTSVVVPANDSVPQTDSLSISVPANSVNQVMSASSTPWSVIIVLAVLVLCFGALFTFRRYFGKKYK